MKRALPQLQTHCWQQITKGCLQKMKFRFALKKIGRNSTARVCCDVSISAALNGLDMIAFPHSLLAPHAPTLCTGTSNLREGVGLDRQECSSYVRNGKLLLEASNGSD